MSLNARLIALFGVWFLKRRRDPGQVALWIVLLYSITRFLIENFRGDAVRGTWFGGSLSTSQSVAVGTGLSAVVLRVRFHVLRQPPPPCVV